MQNELIALLTDIRDNKIKHDITLYDGASAEEIAEFEERMGIVLPEDWKIFYSFCNGFESAEDMFRMIPLSETLDSKSQGYDTDLKYGCFHIAEYMIYSEQWTVCLDNEVVDEYYIYITTEKQVTLTKSLAAFLKVFLKGGVFDGLDSWRESIAPLSEEYKAEIQKMIDDYKTESSAATPYSYFEEKRKQIEDLYSNRPGEAEHAESNNFLERIFRRIFK